MGERPIKFSVAVEKKSKLTSNDWKTLGKFMSILSSKEDMYLAKIEHKQRKASGNASETICVGSIFVEPNAAISKSMFREDNLVIVARDDYTKSIIGVCAVQKSSTYADCNCLYVDEDYRFLGIGTALLERAFEEVKKSKINSLSLRVSMMNKGAQALYKKLGFSPTAYLMEKWM